MVINQQSQKPPKHKCPLKKILDLVAKKVLKPIFEAFSVEISVESDNDVKKKQEDLTVHSNQNSNQNSNQKGTGEASYVKSADVAESIEKINREYREAEQCKLDYYWVDNWKNEYNKKLGFKYIFFQLDSLITKYFDETNGATKEFIKTAILEQCKVELSELVQKSLYKFEAREVFDGSIIDNIDKSKEQSGIKSEELEEIKRQIKDTKFKYGEISPLVCSTENFIKKLKEFFPRGIDLLEKNEFKEYLELQRDFLKNIEDFTK